MIAEILKAGLDLKQNHSQLELQDSEPCMPTSNFDLDDYLLVRQTPQRLPPRTSKTEENLPEQPVSKPLNL